MTLANHITLSRLLFTGAMFTCVMIHGVAAKTAAIVLFIIASLTDWLDGKIARDTGTTTVFGAIADPFVDKILVLAAFVAFASVRDLAIPLWAVFLIVVREMMISSLRVLAALQGNVMSAERAGKLKTAFQYIAISIILVILDIHAAALSPSMSPGVRTQARELFSVFSQWPYVLTVITAVITVLSGIAYLYNHWDLLRNSWSVPPGKAHQ